MVDRDRKTDRDSLLVVSRSVFSKDAGRLDLLWCAVLNHAESETAGDRDGYGIEVGLEIGSDVEIDPHTEVGMELEISMRERERRRNVLLLGFGLSLWVCRRFFSACSSRRLRKISTASRRFPNSTR